MSYRIMQSTVSAPVGVSPKRAFAALLLACSVAACDAAERTTAPTTVDAVSASVARTRTQEFVDAQGTYCHAAKPGHCENVAAKDIGYILGWCDYGCVTGFSIDIGGVNQAWWARRGLPSLGAYSYTGSVTESRLSDGRRKIVANLHARNTFVHISSTSTDPEVSLVGALFQDYPLQSQTPTNPAVGDAHVSAEMIVPADFVGMPDLVQILFYPAAGMEIRRIRVDAYVTGTLRADYQGLAAGTRVDVHGASNWMPKLGAMVVRNDRLVSLDYEVMSSVMIKPAQPN